MGTQWVFSTILSLFHLFVVVCEHIAPSILCSLAASCLLAHHIFSLLCWEYILDPPSPNFLGFGFFLSWNIFAAHLPSTCWTWRKMKASIGHDCGERNLSIFQLFWWGVILLVLFKLLLAFLDILGDGAVCILFRCLFVWFFCHFHHTCVHAFMLNWFFINLLCAFVGIGFMCSLRLLD